VSVGGDHWGARAYTGAGVPEQHVPRETGGDLEFREYVTARGRALLRTAYLLTGNLADAEDLLQAALAKTYLAWDSDLTETLRAAIDRLPHRMRTAVVLRYYEDMTEAEVAERLGVSLGTVKSTVSRAVAKLRIDAELLAD
jgi:DNA-directed RNA polymerase specialized sigma24 family protein